MRNRLRFAVSAPIAALLLAALPAISPAQERDRGKVPERYKWNLADIYADVNAWRAAKERVTAEIPKIRAFQGQLAGSPSVLADAMDLSFRLDKEVSRIRVYASMLADQDMRESAPQGMRQEVQQLTAAYRAAASFMAPEILKAGAATIDQFLEREPRLKVYTFELKDIVRRTAHTLTDGEEGLLAGAGPMASASSDIFGILSNADFPYPSLRLSDGRTVKLDQAGYNDLRALPNRADREKVMSTFLQALGGFSRTYGATMNGSVQRSLFFAKAHKYPATLESSLDAANIPVQIYTRLVDGVNRSLPAFHRYLKLRQRILGVEQLHYYDLYAPLTASVNLKYTADEAEKLVLAAVAPLGADYASVVERAFNERWIDLMPTEGKRNGAYSTGGAYDVHPYMLIKYLGKYNDVSTVAHEMGHTMQSYYSNKTQPYALAGYPIFVAEVASTFNEALLNDYMLKQIKDDETRLSLLGSYLENIKGTLFRQTQFAEFELRMHERAQAGLPLTGDALSKLYLDITRKYYGHDQGICIVDDYVANEWSFIPHFYNGFYVYQYATSFTASSALAEKVMSGDAAAKQRYLTFISSGGSKYPIELLKDAGVDMTTDEPLNLTVKKMNQVMDEMEALLAKVPARR
jgi:oligoendopeptidase F